MSEPSEAVKTAAAMGRKIEAVKLLRAEQGIGLKEAKDIVDALPAGAHSQTVGRPAGSEDRGTARFVFVLVVIFIAIGAFYLIS